MMDGQHLEQCDGKMVIACVITYFHVFRRGARWSAAPTNVEGERRRWIVVMKALNWVFWRHIRENLANFTLLISMSD